MEIFSKIFVFENKYFLNNTNIVWIFKINSLNSNSRNFWHLYKWCFCDMYKNWNVVTNWSTDQWNTWTKITLIYGLVLHQSGSFYIFVFNFRFLIASFYTKYEVTHFIINSIALVVLALVPKLPQLHRIRLFNINRF